MNLMFDSLSNNLGFGLDFIIFFAVSIGLIIFFAKDFRLGLIISLFTEALLFIWFYYMYEAGYNWNFYLPLISFFIMLILISLSLLFIGDVTRKDGGLV